MIFFFLKNINEVKNLSCLFVSIFSSENLFWII